jgi:hypothetical protein
MVGAKGVVALRIRPKPGLAPRSVIPPGAIWNIVESSTVVPGCTPSPAPGPGLYGTNPPIAPPNGTYAGVVPKYAGVVPNRIGVVPKDVVVPPK